MPSWLTVLAKAKGSLSLRISIQLRVSIASVQASLSKHVHTSIDKCEDVDKTRVRTLWSVPQIRYFSYAFVDCHHDQTYDTELPVAPARIL